LKKIVAANWKLNISPSEGQDFFKKFQSSRADIDIVFFPTALSAGVISQYIPKNMGWGIQNFWHEKSGAFTGENSLTMASAMGSKYALLGHSERRSLAGESLLLINKKLKFASSCDSKIILCVGETLAERESGQTNSVIEKQLSSAIENLNPSILKIDIAYEPVWAIGTGKVASPQQVAETHSFVRGYLDNNSLMASRILYGGSVKPESAKGLSELKYVDGFLVGGASMDPLAFSAICQSV
jgi:triosephosphate isomerase